VSGWIDQSAGDFCLSACQWIGGLVRIEGVARDEVEFGEFYQARRDACLRAVTASVVDRHLAEELVAEAFARAWASWGKVSRHPAPTAWVVRTALNTRVSWWRRRGREVPLAGHDSVPRDQSESLDTAVIAALHRLSARQREVITLRVLLDLDTETTAAVLGIATGTVMTHLSRAIAALRKELVHTNSMEATQ